MHLTYQVARFAVGSCGDRAGVHKVYVGFLLPWHHFEPGLLETSFVCGRLGVVQLAAESKKCYFHRLCEYYEYTGTFPDGHRGFAPLRHFAGAYELGL